MRSAGAVALLALLQAVPVAIGAPSDGLRGAHALLGALPQAQKAPAAAADPMGLGWRMQPEQTAAADKLTADVAAFAWKMPEDKDAGTHWAALFERWYALRHPSAGENVYVRFDVQRLFGALPPPEHWLRIAASLRASHAIKQGADPTKSQLAVLTFADKLAGDTAALKQRLAQFEAMRDSASKRDGEDGEWLNMIVSSLGRIVDSDGDAATRFADRLRQHAASREDLRVPDLVTLAGETRATELLLRALTESDARLEIEVGDATRALAAKLALENVEKLRVAQWNLVRGLDCAPLFEALQRRRFGAAHGGSTMSLLLGLLGLEAPSVSDYFGKRALAQAKVHYFGALIARDRAEDAERVAQEFGEEISQHGLDRVLDALDQAGYTRQVYMFLDRFLERHPAVDLWDSYFEFAARSGEQQAMLAHVRANIAGPQGKAHASTLRGHLIDALLAADKVDEAVAEMSALFADPLALAEQRTRYGLKLAGIGRLYEHPDWIESGLAADQHSASTELSSRGDQTTERVRLLVKLQRYAEAESLLAKQLEQQHALDAGSGRASRNVLLELAQLYHSAGRDADVRVLLDESADWRAPDLGKLLQKYDTRTLVLGLSVANALHAAGEDTKAVVVLETLIDRFGGADAPYALYTQLRGDAAIAFLDRVHAGDRFEERPLIWKATLLLKSTHLDEAERVARAAIAIDPSDGEEGPGDRMRAYAVLADILSARGDDANAALYRNAVGAIRESERADEFRLAGLHTHAITLYAKALERFADAYCIQSRLAVELNASGNALLAQEHYRRAYELMPSSFGRLESHCLGCENVFGGRMAQGIAEQVFTQLAQKTPASPQVHYLLGYLREQQERYAEASTQYQTASRLDPEYLNAWKRQRDIGKRIDLPAAERGRVDLRLLELDPRGRHVDIELDSVADWTAVYNVAAKAHAELPHQARSVYPLAQSGKQASDDDSDVDYLRNDASVAPGAVISRTELMRTMTTVM